MQQLGHDSTIIVGQAKPEDVLTAIQGFPEIKGAFVFPGVGLWEGIEEPAVCIYADGLPFPTVIGLAGYLRDTFAQSCVLVRRNGESFLV